MAGVTISAITGNESIMEKGTEAKQKSQEADELDTIKMAVIEAMAQGLDGKVSLENLKVALRNIPDVVSEEEVAALSGNGPWEFEGKHDIYTVTEKGNVKGLIKIGEPLQADKYGYKVTGYISSAETNQDDIGWRLFYQDSENTFLIAKTMQDIYMPSDYYNASGETRYTTGARVSSIGKGLNSAYYREYKYKFNLGTSPTNMRAIAWMTDINNSLWTQYKDRDGKAEWAIASPTIELFVASFNAVKENIDTRIEAGETGLTARTALRIPELNSNGNGYITGLWGNSATLSSSYNHSIYNNGLNNWWLASPSDYGNYRCLMVYPANGGTITSGTVFTASCRVRPIVCIPTNVFNEAVLSGIYVLTDVN